MRALRDVPPELTMHWTPNRVTALRVVVGFSAVCLFGRGPWMNLTAVALTVASIALDALDGHIARRRNLATPVGAQIDILGDRMIENVYFTYFRSGRHGVAVAAGVFLRARCGHRLPARTRHGRRPFRLGRERHAANLVGTHARSFALEPWLVRGDEVPLLLLPRVGVSADARPSGIAG